MKSNIFKLILLVGVLFLPNIACAQAAEKQASSGMLVVAAMETVGYHAQAQVLTQLNEMMKEVSGLIYLGVILSVILTTGLMGNYGPVLWLLIGPPMFVFVSGVEISNQKNRISARGPQWQFGVFQGDENIKQRVMKRQDSPADVSFVFHKYNEIISESYQLLIKELTNKDVTKQILFMARQRVLETLFGLELSNGSSKQLARNLFGECSSELSLARLIAQGQVDAEVKKRPGYQIAKDQYCEQFPALNKDIVDKGLKSYLKTLDDPYKDGEVVSCLRMWNWLRQSVQKDIVGETEASINNIFGPEVHKYLGGASAAINRTVNDVAKKIFSPNVLQEKRTNEDKCPYEANFNESTTEQVGSFVALTNVFSGLMIKKEQALTANSSDFQKILSGNMSGVVAEDDSARVLKVDPGGKAESDRRTKAQEFATGRRYEAFSLLMLLPYAQGALLYILALIYPFFAMLILVPGKAGNFLTWLALWAWVKSWDVGWAVVMMADQLLWEVMPKPTFFDGQAGKAYTPVGLLEMHFSGDYGYSTSLYWTMLGTLVAAVPVITAEIILGAKRSISGAITGFATDYAGRMASVAENWVSTDNVGKQLDPREQSAAMKIINDANSGMAGLNEGQESINKDLGKGQVKSLGADAIDQFKGNLGTAQESGEQAANASAAKHKTDNENK